VGISLSAVGRTARHRKSKWYPLISTITIENFPSRQAAAVAEMEAITCENPKYNKKRPYKGNNLIKKRGSQIEILRPEYSSWSEVFAAAGRIFPEEMVDFYDSLDDLEITLREADPNHIDW